MLLQFKRLPLVALTAVALTGCGSGTGPGAEAFDAEQTTANLATVEGVYETPQFQSLTVLGDHFGSAAAAAAVASAEYLAEGTTGTGLSARAVSLGNRLADAFSTAAFAPLIPESWMGRVYVWDAEENQYVLDAAQTGPENGVRFELYAVNPVTEQILPDEPIGHVDVLDEGTNNSTRIRLIVQSEEVVYLNYAITATGVINAPVFEIDGFVTDGENRVDFELSHALAVTFAGSTVNIDYALSATPADFSVVLQLQVVTEDDVSTAEVLIVLSNGSDEIRLEGSVVDDEGSIDVSGNSVQFATINVSPGNIEVVNEEGGELSEEEIAALRQIWNVVEEVTDAFDRLFRPVRWLFDFDA